MSLEYKTKGNNLVIYLKESLDIANSAYVERNISQLITEYNDHDIVLNMDSVKYMNSAGLGVLIILTKELEKKERILKISNLNYTLRKVINILDAETLVNIYDDERDAVMALNA
ncbi:MAG TPA: STAS domain-containing protein [Spirochaetota bacterium]|nr:STAS domain-containing protein [Spirochaetota bacterium]HPF04935.1 STAS domain-containing protein [Spirochaetota bacterium]HPJ40950.1 STAS domain-containing protein [Spirochaetota bacterium]HPR37103.1 STAS domain-containing protein [Spirochaetota bacterium]HRX46180.1 STAS domain-containing protein [Spirochaetota bacterium]